jgi:uncharacterized membrane protein (DUF373 family)
VTKHLKKLERLISGWLTMAEKHLIDYVKRFETLMITVLMVLMALVIVLAGVELAWMLIRDIISPPFDLLRIGELLEIFGLFLLVLIGVELLDTLRTYFMEHVFHVEVVLTVALIAVSRKIIILDLKKTSPPTLLGLGVIVVALSLGYYFLKRSHRESEEPKKRTQIQRKNRKSPSRQSSSDRYES